MEKCWLVMTIEEKIEWLEEHQKRMKKPRGVEVIQEEIDYWKSKLIEQ